LEYVGLCLSLGTEAVTVHLFPGYGLFARCEVDRSGYPGTATLQMRGALVYCRSRSWLAGITWT